jgi:outer membrane beta-barrel protein
MTPRLARIVLSALTLALSQPLLAQQSPAPSEPATPGTNEQVVVPEVARREVKMPRFPSKDFSIGAFAGTYSAPNFGASAVYGGRLGYHITEDFFTELVLAKTKISDEDFRQILPGGIFPTPEQTLTYYNLSVGYNVLPGEIFIGRRWAKASAVYLVGGVGSTRFLEQRRQTINFGLGMRVMAFERFGIQVDLRDHVYTLDILGRRESKQNIELTAGLTFYF